MAIPKFGRYTKNLPKGVHSASWAEVERALGFNDTRRALLAGLLEGCKALRAAGVSCLYLDGSFATGKTKPNDYDACYSIRGVKGSLMDRVLLDFSDGRAAMKAKYKGEFFPAEWGAGRQGTPYLEYLSKGQGRALEGHHRARPQHFAMIKNSRELKHSIEQIQQLRTALDQFDEENCPAEVDPLIHRAYRDGLASQLESLEREVAEFERLQTGDFDWSGLGDPATHPEILIKARIARKLSERQLAERIGATARQIREWEDNDYDGVAASRIGAIARALDINAPRRPFLTIEAPRGSISDLLAIAQQLGAVASATFSPRRFAGALHEPVTGALGADLVLAMLAFGEARTAVSFLTEAARWATENRQSVAIKGLDGRTALSLGAGAEYPEEELARIVAALEQSETPA